MADIFAGTQPPAWMERNLERAERIGGQWGNLAGTVGGGLINSLRRENVEVPTYDKDTGEQVGTQIVKGPRIGFREGLAEARMNQADPQWRLKRDALQVGMMGQMAQMEATHAIAQTRKEELAAWMNDAPLLAPWLAATPEQRQNMTPPVDIRSTKGATMLERANAQDANYWMKKDSNRIREESAKNAMYRADTINSWSSFIAQDEKLRGAIYGLANQGMNVNADGIPTGPTVAAQAIADKWATDNKKMPWGISRDKEQSKAWLNEQQNVAKAAAAAEAQKGKLAVGAQQIEGRKGLQEDQQAHQKEMQEARIKSVQDNMETMNKHREHMLKETYDQKSDYLKEQEDYRMGRLEASQRFYGEPKSFTMPDGSIIVTRGKSMVKIAPQGDKNAQAKLKSDLGVAANRIKLLDKQVSRLPVGSKQHTAAMKALFDAHVAYEATYLQNTQNPTAKEIRTVVENTPEEAAPVDASMQGHGLGMLGGDEGTVGLGGGMAAPASRGMSAGERIRYGSMDAGAAGTPGSGYRPKTSSPVVASTNAPAATNDVLWWNPETRKTQKTPYVKKR